MSNDRFGFHQNLPESIRDVFMWLCQDVAMLRLKWNFYIGLYSSKESTDLMSDLAPASFRIIEESLRADMTMAICRLSDPIETRGQNNLSICTLCLLLSRMEDNQSLVEMLEDFKQACKPVRALRNKRVGHNDLHTRIRPQKNPLPGIRRSQIEHIVEQAEKILNYVYQCYVDSQLSFGPIHVGGADTLLFWLRKGWESEFKDRKIMRRGAA
jgi:hypothetical protein